MRGPAKLATYIAYAMVVAGFAVIFLAWNGAAELDFVQGQFPYLLSGGLTGLGLVVAGTGVLFVQTVRELSAERVAQMQAVNAAFGDLVQAVRSRQGVATSPATQGTRGATGPPAAAGRTARSRRQTSSLTSGSPDQAEALERSEARRTEAALAGVQQDAARSADEVVVGRSSFHNPACHLVTGRSDLEEVPREVAERQGLKACRICKP